MNILVLSPTLRNTAPGMRFRMEQWIPYLEQQGFHFTFVPFEDEALHEVIYQPGRYVRKAAMMMRALLRRFTVPFRLGDFDAVFLYREAALIGPAIIERLIARRGVPIVYDFDDPIWLPYRSPTNSVFSSLKWPSKTVGVCRLAAMVTVGNRLLASWAERHSRQVAIVPSTVDVHQYPIKADHGERKVVTLGWTGSHSTLPFLKSLEGTLRRLAAQQPFRLVIVSHTDCYRLDGLPVETVARKWQAGTEAIDLQEIDIGLGPFPDTGWTPWRCHGKVLQYMAVGIPCVVSRIGILSDYINDGVEGFTAASEAEWIDRLATLIKDADLRRQMGKAARTAVERNYSAEVWAPRMGEIFEKVTTASVTT